MKLVPLVKALFLIGNPASVKWALNDIAVNAGPLRPPLVDPGDDIQQTIRSLSKSRAAKT